MAQQSLYRRYRPRTFGQVRGQDHVVRALRNAVDGSTEGHAYLFSGPRGTGKTSTARILAKALNCEHLVDGEPCCECRACREIEAGQSFDLLELDAASNNRVDDIRDLVERAATGSPGRTKVYILDEVHMLTTAASNALLKTLEEPPEQVCFVLATTDPHKVLPTIRSRTQHYEFSLLSATELEDYVRWVVADAGLTVDDDAVHWVVRQGRGSARDTLSALDQVVAAGGVVVRAEPVEQLYQAVVDRDPGAAIAAVADSLAHGHDPRVLGDAFLSSLRDCFLVSLGVDVPHLVDDDRQRLAAWAEALGTARITRTMESVGTAMVEMRQAADARIPLEVALVRLTSAADDSIDGLVARIEALEAALADGGAPVVARPGPSAAPAPPAEQSSAPPAAPPAAPPSAPRAGRGAAAEARAALARTRGGAESAAPAAPATPPAAPAPARAATPADHTDDAPPPDEPPPVDDVGSTPPPSAPPPSAPPPSGSRPALGAMRRRGAAAPEAPAPPAAAPAPAPASAPARSAPSPVGPAPDAPAGADLVDTFVGEVVPAMKGVAKALYSGARILGAEGSTLVVAFEDDAGVERAERSRSKVEEFFADKLGRPASLRLVTEAQATAMGAAAPSVDDVLEDEVDLAAEVHDLEEADIAVSGIEKLTQAFPGAQMVESDDTEQQF